MPSAVHVERPNTAECPSSRAALYSRSLVIATPHLISVPIRRPAVTLLVSLNERPFNVAVPQVGNVNTLAALVGAGQGRVLRAGSCDLLSINLEPGHVLFRPLQRALAERPLQSLAPAGWTGVQDLLRRCFEADVPSEPHVEALVELCGRAGVALNCSLRPSDRVWELLAVIDAGFPEGVSLSQLADRFCLSESRLSHLFVEEVGIPLRTYLLWRRYRLAFSRLTGQSTLTRLASDSGFADAAHLTRTFVGYFGFSPRRILHSCFIQDLTRG
ncbi:AraC family transcriptional regulator [Cupriavidus oxalaticus]|uniref:helix-turn-helix domain-containing protein n=1 Tax=Cupriavidus oxalaticus TaxID=96344 RepID=UPI003171F69B